MDLIQRAAPIRVKNFLFFIVLLLCLFNNRDLKAQTDQTVRTGSPTKPITFPATGCTYGWINTEPSIGLPASGTGDIPSFTAVNNGNIAITAKIIAAPVPVPPHIYSLGADANVSVLDADTRKQVGTIPVQYGILADKSPDGNLLYFFSTADRNTLFIASAVTYEVLAALPLSVSYPLIIPSPDGSRIYAVGTTGPVSNPIQQVVVIDAATRTITGTLDLTAGRNAYTSPKLTPDGTRLYLLDQLGGYVTVYNTVTNSIAANIPVPQPVFNVMNPNGKEIYVTGLGTSLLYVINTATNEVSTYQLGGNSSSILMSPDGRKLYLRPFDQTSDRIDVYDTQAKTVSTISIGTPIGQTSLSPDGNTMYILGAGATVTIVETQTYRVLATLKTSHVSSEEGYYLSNVQLTVGRSGDYVYVDHTIFNYYFYVNQKYLTVINTLTNSIVDSIPNGTVPPQPNTAGACSGPPVTYTIKVNPPPPNLFSAGTVEKQTSVYGAPSTGEYFEVSGDHIGEGILITPPKGFEVSTDGITFGDTIRVKGVGVIASTRVYVRLGPKASAGPHPGDIVLTSGETTLNVAIGGGEITPASLTIIADKVSKIYGSALTSGPGSTAFTAPELKNGETIGSVTITYGPASAATTKVGTYPAQADVSEPVGGTFNAANYTIGFTKNDIVVTPAPLIITAENKTRGYGDPDPPLTVKYDTFVNNEDASALSVLPKLSTTAGTYSIIGDYPITVYGAAADNYTITYVPGIFSIIAKPVTAANAFTPNGDGVNDTWQINNIGQYPGNMVRIFNRYGQVVFYTKGYTTAFDGRFNGADLSTGTYYYIINLNKDMVPLTGSLTIIR